MKFGSVGAVIAAASKKDAVPLLKVGSIPIVRRIVLTLQEAGIFPIVVVTGTEELEVTRQVAPLGVVFIKNTECEKPELFSSVKLGLSYLQGKCDRVVFTPVNAPMFFAQTLHTLLCCDADIITPTYDGRGGHPIVMRSEILPQILAYDGPDGLRGAVRQCNCRKQRITADAIGEDQHRQGEYVSQLTAEAAAVPCCRSALRTAGMPAHGAFLSESVGYDQPAGAGTGLRRGHAAARWKKRRQHLSDGEGGAANVRLSALRERGA